MKNTSNVHSDFWLDEFDFEDGEQVDKTARLIRLSMFRRSVANFVSILTGQSVPVVFNDSGHNMTDGTTVYLSSEIENLEDFDSLVGLALHEGSHVVLTDFRVINDLWQNVPRELYNIAEQKGFSKADVASYLKNMLNVIEDRYIDNFVYTTAPGYRGYYLALYDRYFNSSHISTMLKSDMYRTLTVQSYEARVINLTNSATNLNALPDFLKIVQTIDIKNINRLKTTKDRFDIAVEVCKIIYSNVEMIDGDKPESGQSNESGTGTGNETSIVLVQGNSSESDDFGGVETSVNETNQTDKSEDYTKKENSQSTVSKTKQSVIDKALKKQKAFILGEIKKKKILESDKKLLDNLEAAGVTIVTVGTKIDDTSPVTKGIECIVVKNLTKELLMTEECPCSHKDVQGNLRETNRDSVNRGIQLGNLLGKRLSLRSEINTTKYMRKSMGKIDRRVLSELGFENDTVFYRTDVDQYKTAFLHISIDASSSMAGKKWEHTIMCITAICKAASMINNLKVSVSMRTTSRRGLPYVAMVYDSSKDSFSKVRNIFPYLDCCGSTPEGLCYEAIMKNLNDCGENEDYYFLNLSDGQPCYYHSSSGMNYGESNGGTHTRRQVNKIRNKGYKILAYYIDDSYNIGHNTTVNCFKRMYGSDAQFIDITNIISVAKTLNTMFLNNSNKV
jgi:hypothetical protein